MNPHDYTGPDIEIECERVRLAALENVHCIEALIEDLIVQLEDQQALYLRLTRERRTS